MTDVDIVGYAGYLSMTPSFFRQIAENPVFTTATTTTPLPTPEVREATRNRTDKDTTYKATTTMATTPGQSWQEPVARFYDFQDMGIDSQLLSLGRQVTRDKQGNRYLTLYNKTCAVAPDNTVKWCKDRPFGALPSPILRDSNGTKTLYSLLSIPKDCQNLVNQIPEPSPPLTKSDIIIVIEELDRIDSLKGNRERELLIKESINTETTLKYQPPSEGLIKECLKTAGKNSILAVSAMDAETGSERFAPFFSTPSNDYLPYGFPFNVFSQQTGIQYVYTLSYGPGGSSSLCRSVSDGCTAYLYGLDEELKPVLELNFPYTGSQKDILTPMTLYENKRGHDELTLVLGDTVHQLEIKPGVKTPLRHGFFAFDSGYDSQGYNAYRAPVRTGGRLFILRDLGEQGHLIFEFDPEKLGQKPPVIHHLSGFDVMSNTVLAHENGFLTTFQQKGNPLGVDVQWFDTSTEGQISHASIASFVMDKDYNSWFSNANWMFIGKAMVLNNQLILSGAQSQTRICDGYVITRGILIFMDWQPNKISHLVPLETIQFVRESPVHGRIEDASGSHRSVSTIAPLMALIMTYALF